MMELLIVCLLIYIVILHGTIILMVNKCSIRFEEIERDNLKIMEYILKQESK